MGDEYKLAFRCADPRSVVAHLGRLAGASAATDLSLEFRAPGNSGRMPDACVRLEEYGAYFCVNGGHGRAFLGRVIAWLVAECGSVLVTELE